MSDESMQARCPHTNNYPSHKAFRAAAMYSSWALQLILLAVPELDNTRLPSVAVSLTAPLPNSQ